MAASSKANGSSLKQNRKTQQWEQGHPKERLKSVFTESTLPLRKDTTHSRNTG